MLAKLDGLPVNFIISDAAIHAIARLRREWDAQFSDKAGVLMVGWGEYHVDGLKKLERIIITFYSQKEMNQVRMLVEHVSGIEVIFYITKANYSRFERKVIDYNDDAWFFLR